jgi:hypothetical protein
VSDFADLKIIKLSTQKKYHQNSFKVDETAAFFYLLVEVFYAKRLKKMAY